MRKEITKTFRTKNENKNQIHNRRLDIKMSYILTNVF